MISRSLGIVCYYRWIFSDGHENYFKDWCLMNSQLVFLISTSFQFIEIVILSKGRKPDKFESQLKFEKQKVENLWNLALPIFEFNIDILALCETNLDDSIGSGDFSVRGYLPTIRKDSVSRSWSYCLWEEKVSFCTGLISRKLFGFLFMFLVSFISFSVLLLSPISITFFIFMYGFWCYLI